MLPQQKYNNVSFVIIIAHLLETLIKFFCFYLFNLTIVCPVVKFDINN